MDNQSKILIKAEKSEYPKNLFNTNGSFSKRKEKGFEDKKRK